MHVSINHVFTVTGTEGVCRVQVCVCVCVWAHFNVRAINEGERYAAHILIFCIGVGGKGERESERVSEVSHFTQCKCNYSPVFFTEN